MTGIFISYRRADAGYVAGRLRNDDAMLVVIGQRWLGATDAEGRRRLDQPDDVEDARLPAVADLPADLRDLTLQQAVTLPDARWDDEVARLVARLRAALGMPEDGGRVFPERMRFHLTVDNRTFDVTDDTGHQYPAVGESVEWPVDLGPGTTSGVVAVGVPLQPRARGLQAGWVRALGTFEQGSLYATVRLPR